MWRVFSLDTIRMREWGEWTARARAYIRDLPQWVPLRTLIDEYADMVNDFFAWLSRRHREENRAAIDESSV